MAHAAERVGDGLTGLVERLRVPGLDVPSTDDGRIVTAVPVGDGAIHASITDMFSWGRYLLTHVDPFIDEVEPADGGRLYGAGVWVEEIDGHDVVWHAGGWQGFASYFAIIPDEGLTVAVLCNRADADPFWPCR